MTRRIRQLVLGVEGGATKTEWIWAECQADKWIPVDRGRLGPGNMALLGEAGVRALLAGLPSEASRCGIFLAGCATAEDRYLLRRISAERWPEAVLAVGSDRESGYAAALGNEDGIHVIAGTGSAVTGRKDSREDLAGGWGHLLGDSGGGYDLAIQGLRKILFDFDTARLITPWAAEVLRELGLNTLRDLNGWAQKAQKSDLAQLTPLLFQHADDPAIREILETGARSLARRVEAVARRLNLDKPRVRLSGGVFTGQPLYGDLFETHLALPGSSVQVSRKPGSEGAVFLASGATRAPAATAIADEPTLIQSPTEQANPRSAHLSELSVPELVALFIREERLVENALERAAENLVRAIEVAVRVLGNGGRLFYAGAGTSGRLGVLDASEIPPTFGLPPDRVQAIMAGGAQAVWQSVEGAEDDPAAGAAAIRDRGVRSGDLVCGISASGRTPFVKGALQAAETLGCATLFITCNPHRPPLAHPATVEIDLATGPELLTGSTRLKAGTATKVALNILTTGTMVRLGYAQGNLMTGLKASNEKLRARAARIVASLLQTSEDHAIRLLDEAQWNIAEALRLSGQGRRSS